MAPAATALPVAFAQEESFSGCPVLREGVENDDLCVTTLQEYLQQENPAHNLPATGFFGAQTRIAVLDFQGRNGLGADGIVGRETARLLVEKVPFDIGVPPVEPNVWGDLTSKVLAEQCPESFASLDDYLSGRVEEPRCFPYSPEIVQTAWGQRAIDPYRDGCSGPTDDHNKLWDRRIVCGTHDYAYDLLRYGVDTFREPNADHYFLRDMLSECEQRSHFATERACKDQARVWRAGVQEGDVDPGDDIADGTED
jgi:hypothetical protein